MYKILIFWGIGIIILIAILSIFIIKYRNHSNSNLDDMYYYSHSKHIIYCKSKEKLYKFLFQNLFNKYDLVYIRDTSEIYQFDGKNMNKVLKNYSKR